MFITTRKHFVMDCVSYLCTPKASKHNQSTRLAHRRSSRRPDHGPVPSRLPGPRPQALSAEDKGEDENEEQPEADHGHSDEGGLHAYGVHHGVDVEGDHEGDDVLEAAYQGQGVGALGEVWSWGVNDVWL